MDVHHRNAAILADGRVPAGICKLSNAGGAANYLAAHHFQAHRGAWLIEGGRILVFGNDGFTGDERARREVAEVVDAASEIGVRPEEFGLCDEGYTWALVLGGVDGDAADRAVHRMRRTLWASWLRASGEERAEKFSRSIVGLQPEADPESIGSWAGGF